MSLTFALAILGLAAPLLTVVARLVSSVAELLKFDTSPRHGRRAKPVVLRVKEGDGNVVNLRMSEQSPEELAKALATIVDRRGTMAAAYEERATALHEDRAAAHEDRAVYPADHEATIDDE
jgi:hypothetical protein